MNCPACQTDNREIARFCRECGRFLASACPHCDAELPSASRYCDQCGQPLAVQAGEAQPPPTEFRQQASRPAASASTPGSGEPADSATRLARFMPEALVDKLQTARSQGGMVGERRFVTMLFCDVSGSTAAASGMDPEEWAGVINGAFEHMIAPIYRYEGTVARLMGDGLLAFFGAPIAHEDDPVRAVRAGLDIVAHVADYNRQVQQQHGVELAVRVGINSGRVVVGAVGSDLRVEYSALGDAINIAARMEQAAAPNTVQIAAATHRLVAPLFEIEELGEIEIKGKAEPVPAYRVLGRQAEPGRLRGIAGLESPLVGRQTELDTLRQQLDDLTQGRGGIVFLLGQPGLGKSRLLREWRADWPEPEGPRYWSISQEASYQAAEAYGLLRQLLRLVVDVGSDDGQADQSLRTRLEELVSHLPSAGQSDILVPLARLLDVQSNEEAAAPVEAETFRRQLFAANRAVLQQLTERQPTALILDDLHWADPASTEAISSLFQLVDAAPLLFVCVMRPEREAASWELYNAAKNDFPHRLTEIALSPLSNHESIRLLEGLLPGARWPRRLREQVLEKAAGVPFFLEEVVRALLEDDVIQQADGGWKVKETGDDVRLPGSLQGLLTARLDRLEEESRRILQLASVIGQAFDYPLLAQLCGAANGSNGSSAGEAGTLDRRLTDLQRADLIVETARIPQRRYLFRNTLIQETAYRTMLREQRRATHREVAEALTGRNGEEIAALAHHFYQAGDPRAVAANRQAGDAAFDLHAGKEAATYYRRALELARRHQHDDVALLVYLYRRLGRSLELASQFSQALDLYADMKELAEELDDRQLALDAMLRQATMYATASDQRDFEKAVAVVEQVLPLARELGDKAAESKSHWLLLNVYRVSAKVGKAIEAGETALAVAQANNLTERAAFAAHDLTHAYMFAGRSREALASITAAGKHWQELNNLPMLADSLSTASLLSGALGELEQALEQAAEAERISMAIDNVWGQSYSLLFVGHIHWEQGRPAQAVEIMERCLALGEQAGFTVPKFQVGAQLTTVYTHLGHKERALSLAQEIDREIGQRASFFEQLGLPYLAQTDLLIGNLDRAQERLASIPILEDAAHSLLLYIVGPIRVEAALRIGDHKAVVEVGAKLAEKFVQMGWRMYLARVLGMLGEAYLAQGRLDEAAEALAEARQEAEVLGVDWQLWPVLAAQSALAQARGDRQEAQSLYRQSRQLLTEIADRAPTPESRAALLNHPYWRWRFATLQELSETSG